MRVMTRSGGGAAVTSDDGLAPTIATTPKELKFQDLRGLFTADHRRDRRIEREKKAQKEGKRERAEAETEGKKNGVMDETRLNKDQSL
jgi:hypothetical protein